MTIRQQVYAFCIVNPNCTTAQVAQHINKSEQYTAKAMHCMKLANMLLSTKQANSVAHVWRVSNKAVKFNTGETVRAKRTRQATVKQQIAAIEASLLQLKKQLA